MRLREELYITAAKVLGEEPNLTQTHYRVVEQHLETICRKTAAQGKFYVKDITLVKLADESQLTKRDIEEFAKAHGLDYNPGFGSNGASLGFPNV